MTTRLILQFDDDTKFQQILNLAKRLKVPFRFDFVTTTLPETENIVWHWDDCETAELSLETFSEDWYSEADTVWDTV